MLLCGCWRMNLWSYAGCIENERLFVCKANKPAYLCSVSQALAKPWVRVAVRDHLQATHASRAGK